MCEKAETQTEKKKLFQCPKTSSFQNKNVELKAQKEAIEFVFLFLKLKRDMDCFYFQGPTGFYILEGLQPRTTYDFRFGAKNLVGFSEWGAAQQFTMPQRGPPEAPIMNTLVSDNIILTIKVVASW